MKPWSRTWWLWYTKWHWMLPLHSEAQCTHIKFNTCYTWVTKSSFTNHCVWYIWFVFRLKVHKVWIGTCVDYYPFFGRQCTAPNPACTYIVHTLACTCISVIPTNNTFLIHRLFLLLVCFISITDALFNHSLKTWCLSSSDTEDIITCTACCYPELPPVSFQ